MIAEGGTEYGHRETIARSSQPYGPYIGDGCRERQIEYSGHVIEDNNIHARLGVGSGHLFRALGQDMLGWMSYCGNLIPALMKSHRHGLRV